MLMQLRVLGWLSLWLLSSQLVREEVYKEGLRHLMLANANTCGLKVGEICRGSAVAILALIFSVVKSTDCVCKAGHCEPLSIISTAWLLLAALALLPSSYLSLYISALPVSRWGETEVTPSCGAPGAGEACHSLHSSFPREGNAFLLGSSLLAASSAGLGMG